MWNMRKYILFALMAVAAWLGEIGRNNRMFFFPMCFMLLATLTSLVITGGKKIAMVMQHEAAWGDWFQLIFAYAMALLAMVLVREGIRTFRRHSHRRDETPDVEETEETDAVV